MIDWIKFKGSTEEERERELMNKYPAILYHDKEEEVATSYNPDSFVLMNYSHYFPINLPQEEKWEREIDFNYSYEGGPLILSIHKEFDNIYSILNELRKR